MTWVSRLEVIDLRNIQATEVHLDRGLNVLVGRNAQGKTSLLEALGADIIDIGGESGITGRPETAKAFRAISRPLKMRSGGMPMSTVRNSHAQWIASRLK